MFSEVLLYIGLVFTVLALLVRFAGNRPVLAGSRYMNVRDMKALNIWAGNRLLLLPVMEFALALYGTDTAAKAVLSGMVTVFALFGVIVWISIGGKRFCVAD